jgi:hypothetical protein
MATVAQPTRTAPPTWPVASGSLLLGFAVAQATGVRPLGGVVLALGAIWCGLRWLRSVGRPRTAGLVFVYVAMFVLSHLMADAIGTWPAVLVAAAVAGLAALVVADIPASRGATAG